jgi:protein TonB
MAVPDTGQSRPRLGRFGGALSLSMGAHAAAVLAILVFAGQSGVAPGEIHEGTVRVAPLVYLAGPEGGGGRKGGDRGTGPLRTARAPGTDRVSVPAARSIVLTPVGFTPREAPTHQVHAAPAQPLGSALDQLPGVVQAIAVDFGSLGPGTGAGPGGTKGSGPGPGSGPGTGPGDGPGGGGGFVEPQIVHQVKPAYTPEAMQARIQGVVTLEAVVLPDGTVGEVRVVRSLDRTFGLDQQAIKAVKEWRFRPGSRRGRPLPMIVVAELSFTLR